MDTQDFKPEVVDLGQQYYDPALPPSPGAEGALVQVNTIPFEQVDQNPALQAYEAAYKKVKTNIKPTTLGVAGILCRSAVRNRGQVRGRRPHRATVLAKLKTIHSWDGGGLQMKTDPGANDVTTCFLYMEVKDGKVRTLPSDEGEHVRLQPQLRHQPP